MPMPASRRTGTITRNKKQHHFSRFVAPCENDGALACVRNGARNIGVESAPCVSDAPLNALKGSGAYYIHSVAAMISRNPDARQESSSRRHPVVPVRYYYRDAMDNIGRTNHVETAGRTRVALSSGTAAALHDRAACVR